MSGCCGEEGGEEAPARGAAIPVGGVGGHGRAGSIGAAIRGAFRARRLAARGGVAAARGVA